MNGFSVKIQFSRSWVSELFHVGGQDFLIFFVCDHLVGICIK